MRYIPHVRPDHLASQMYASAIVSPPQERDSRAKDSRLDPGQTACPVLTRSRDALKTSHEPKASRVSWLIGAHDNSV